MANEEQLSAYLKQKWLQHPEEIDDCYYFFFKYYLSMPRGGRSVLGAYKNYLVAEKGLSEEEASKKQISSYFHNWSNGRDKTGAEIPQLDTYENRAAEYDSWMLSSDINQLIAKRGRIINDEYSDAEKMLYVWKLLMNDVKTQYDSDKQKINQNGKEKDINVGTYLNQVKSLVRARDEIAVFMRRSVGMMDKITEDALTASKDEGLQIEWVEPPISTHENLSDEDKAINQMSYEDFDDYIEKRLGSGDE